MSNRALKSVFTAAFYPGSEDDVLDPVFDLDDQLRDRALQGRLHLVREDVDALLAAATDEEKAEELLGEELRQSSLPDGPAYLDYLEYVHRRVHQLSDDISVATPRVYMNDGLKPPRASRFIDKETAEEACTQVLRRNETIARPWVDDLRHQGIWRQHYYADLGSEVGTIMFAGAVGETQPATAAALVMKFDVESGNPFIYDAWPEIQLDEAVRGRYPDLPHLFGGYFGDVPERPWPAQRNFQGSTRDPARGRIAGQLDELLKLNDDALRHAVEALGSHVLPDAMRLWVERMRWRMDAFDWSVNRATEL